MARVKAPRFGLKMAPEVDKKAQGLMHEVLRECHPRLVNHTLLVIFKQRGPAQVAVATPREGLLKGPHGWVILPHESWTHLDETQREAVMDHLLACFQPNDKTGNLGLVKPDVSEFTAVLGRRGAYTMDLKFFVAKAKQVAIPELESSPEVVAGPGTVTV